MRRRRTLECSNNFSYGSPSRDRALIGIPAPGGPLLDLALFVFHSEINRRVRINECKSRYRSCNHGHFRLVGDGIGMMCQ
jgi:hypothetical protein